MAKYFTAEFQNYYEKLNVADNLVKDATSLKENGNNASSIAIKVQEQFELSYWKELGQAELATSVIPAFKSRIDILHSNISNCLVAAVSKAINDLLPILKDIKNKDEEYCSVVSELASLREPSPKYKTNSNGKETDEYTSDYSYYLETKERLENRKRELEEELTKLTENAYNEISAIKALNGNVVNFSPLSNSTEISGLELTTTEEEYIKQMDALLNNEENESLLESLGLKGTGIIGNSTSILMSLGQLSNGSSAEAQSLLQSLGKKGTTSLLLGALGTGIISGNTILYNDAGGREAGYSRQILTSHGRLVTVFQQGWNKALKFSDSNWTLRDAGCGYNALAAVLSSVDPTITPEQVFVEMGRRYMLPRGIRNYLWKKYRIKVGSREEVSRSNYPAYKAHLVTEVLKGNMVMATVDGRTDSRYTRNNHWVAIVDYDPKTDSFYVTDSADKNDSNAGPIDADTFLKKYSVNTNVIYLANDSGFIS